MLYGRRQRGSASKRAKLTIVSLPTATDRVQRTYRRIPINNDHRPHILLIHPLHRPLARVQARRIPHLAIRPFQRQRKTRQCFGRGELVPEGPVRRVDVWRNGRKVSLCRGCHQRTEDGGVRSCRKGRRERGIG
jgi:hypothetical protein